MLIAMDSAYTFPIFLGWENEPYFILTYAGASAGSNTSSGLDKSSNSFKSSSFAITEIKIKNSEFGVYCDSFGSRVLYIERDSSSSDDNNEDNIRTVATVEVKILVMIAIMMKLSSMNQ